MIINRGHIYPIGEQNFKLLREMNAVYVDKTGFIAKIIESGNKYYFLARPRRFGKSLFLSTLQYFFEGEQKLFTGLDIDNIQWGWDKYPVLRLDLNPELYAEMGKLEDVLSREFRQWEEEYNVDVKDTNLSQRFATIIEAAHRHTNQRVIILVDEYDKPLVSNINNDINFEHYRSQLASIYANFKSSAEHIQLVFLTGVSRFSKLSVFSDLNNLKDISFDDEFSDICGITEKELKVNFEEGIKKISGNNNISLQEAYNELKANYDGYRFSTQGKEIYNPWSILSCFSTGKLESYWTHTGMPTILAEALKRIDADLKETLNSECDIDTLKGLDLRSMDPLALMYQTGYLTIKNYDKTTELIQLGIPNREVRQDIFKVLIPYYVNVKRGGSEATVRKIINNILNGKPEDMMKALQAYFAGIPYDLKMEDENNFQNAFYILTSLIGIKTYAEVRTSEGRIDILIETHKYVYIIKLKYNGSAEEAIMQIDAKNYTRKHNSEERKVFKIGVNFSSKTRCIEDWIIERD